MCIVLLELDPSGGHAGNENYDFNFETAILKRIHFCPRVLGFFELFYILLKKNIKTLWYILHSCSLLFNTAQVTTNVIYLHATIDSSRFHTK